MRLMLLLGGKGDHSQPFRSADLVWMYIHIYVLCYLYYINDISDLVIRDSVIALDIQVFTASMGRLSAEF